MQAFSFARPRRQLARHMQFTIAVFIGRVNSSRGLDIAICTSAFLRDTGATTKLHEICQTNNLADVLLPLRGDTSADCRCGRSVCSSSRQTNFRSSRRRRSPRCFWWLHEMSWIATATVSGICIAPKSPCFLRIVVLISVRISLPCRTPQM